MKEKFSKLALMKLLSCKIIILILCVQKNTAMNVFTRKFYKIHIHRGIFAIDRYRFILRICWSIRSTMSKYINEHRKMLYKVGKRKNTRS